MPDPVDEFLAKVPEPQPAARFQDEQGDRPVHARHADPSRPRHEAGDGAHRRERNGGPPMTTGAKNTNPVPELDPQFSSAGVEPTPWPRALDELRRAGTYWISTVRPNGRPHVTPISAIVVDDELYFCTGPLERKARNLQRNLHVVVTTGSNAIDKGMDIVIEGDVQPVTNDAQLQGLADGYEAKYPGVFGFRVRDGGFWSDDGGTALVFRVVRRKGFAFGKGDEFSQTRWRF
jgi:hypothetical protein